MYEFPRCHCTPAWGELWLENELKESGVRFPLKGMVRYSEVWSFEKVTWSSMDAGVAVSLTQVLLTRWGCDGSEKEMVRNVTLDRTKFCCVAVKLAATALY